MNWLYHKEEFKQILNRTNNPDDEFGSVKATKDELIPFLRRTACFASLSPKVLKQLEQATTFHSINHALDAVYDYADEHRIWLGI